MRPPLHTHSTLACLLDADPLDSLLQIIARAHLGVQEHPAYRRGERKPLLRSLLGSGGARKALARGCGRCVLLPCSARRCPARKSPTHALCRRACVNGRVPLGGFHNYILILSNARGLQLDNSPSTLEFPESAPDIAPSRVLGARRSCGAQRSWRRLIGSARGSSEHPVIVWYGGSLPRLKLARAGRRHTHLRPISALEALAATDFRVRCRLIVPTRGLGDGPSTVWCRVSLPMLKDPRIGRPDAWAGSDPCSPGSPLRGRASERGIGFSINESAVRHVTWIGRRS
jgi:hypothetical protein